MPLCCLDGHNTKNPAWSRHVGGTVSRTKTRFIESQRTPVIRQTVPHPIETRHLALSVVGKKNLLMDPDITPPPLPKLGTGSRLDKTYGTQGFSTHTHSLELLRIRFNSEIRRKDTLENLTHGPRASIVGLIECIQRPRTAKRIALLVLEVEFGLIDVVISPQVFEQYRF